MRSLICFVLMFTFVSAARGQPPAYRTTTTHSGGQQPITVNINLPQSGISTPGYRYEPKIEVEVVVNNNYTNSFNTTNTNSFNRSYSSSDYRSSSTVVTPGYHVAIPPPAAAVSPTTRAPAWVPSGAPPAVHPVALAPSPVHGLARASYVRLERGTNSCWYGTNDVKIVIPAGRNVQLTVNDVGGTSFAVFGGNPVSIDGVAAYPYDTCCGRAQYEVPYGTHVITVH